MKSPVKAVALALLCLSGAGLAHADRPLSNRERAQLRMAPQASVAHAPTNTASVSQEGTGLAGAIQQNGYGNDATLRQVGKDSDGRIVQSGDDNSACLVQLGKNLSGEINQTGDGNSLGVVQTRKGVSYIDPAHCSFQGNAPGMWKKFGRMTR